MKLIYYVPTTEQDKGHLCLEIRHLFEVEPVVIQRATDLQVDLALLDSLADLLTESVVQTPYAIFTLDEPRSLSQEQRTFVCRPGIEVRREYGPEEVLYECIKGNNEV